MLFQVLFIIETVDVVMASAADIEYIKLHKSAICSGEITSTKIFNSSQMVSYANNHSDGTIDIRTLDGTLVRCLCFECVKDDSLILQIERNGPYLVINNEYNADCSKCLASIFES